MIGLDTLGLLIFIIYFLNFSTAFLIIKRFEPYLKQLKVAKTFNIHNSFIARKLFIVIISTLVGLLALGLTSHTLIGLELTKELAKVEAFWRLFLTFLSGSLICIYHLDTILDKRRER